MRTQFDEVSLPKTSRQSKRSFDRSAREGLGRSGPRQLRLDQGALRRTLDAEDAPRRARAHAPEGCRGSRARDHRRVAARAAPRADAPGRRVDGRVGDSRTWSKRSRRTRSAQPSARIYATRSRLFAARRACRRSWRPCRSCARSSTRCGSRRTPSRTRRPSTRSSRFTSARRCSPFRRARRLVRVRAANVEVQVDAGLLGARRDRARARSMRAKEILLNAPPCAPRVPVRGPLDMAPPDERAWACSLLHALDDAPTDLDELAADLALRDAIVVARSAVSTHGPIRAPEAALRRAQLTASISTRQRKPRPSSASRAPALTTRSPSASPPRFSPAKAPPTPAHAPTTGVASATPPWTRRRLPVAFPEVRERSPRRKDAKTPSESWGATPGYARIVPKTSILRLGNPLLTSSA